MIIGIGAGGVEGSAYGAAERGKQQAGRWFAAVTMCLHDRPGHTRGLKAGRVITDACMYNKQMHSQM